MSAAVPLFPEDVVGCSAGLCSAVLLLWGHDRLVLASRRYDAGSCCYRCSVQPQHSTALQRLCGFLPQVCPLRQPFEWPAFEGGLRRKALRQPCLVLLDTRLSVFCWQGKAPDIVLFTRDISQGLMQHAHNYAWWCVVADVTN